MAKTMHTLDWFRLTADSQGWVLENPEQCLGETLGCIERTNTPRLADDSIVVKFIPMLFEGRMLRKEDIING